MELSAYGRRLLRDSGPRSLMADLGAVAEAGGDIMNLGGGTPASSRPPRRCFAATCSVCCNPAARSGAR